jgi:hypothetical protein
LSQLQEIRLKDLNYHEVDIVFAEMEHAVSQLECLLLNPMNIEFLSRLVLQPHLFKIPFNILAVKQMPEYKLVLDYRFVAKNKCERPFYTIL